MTVQFMILVLMESGRSAVELSVFLILPVMVLMMGIMKLLEGLRVLGDSRSQ